MSGRGVSGRGVSGALKPSGGRAETLRGLTVPEGVMIGGISSAAYGLSAAAARFDRAASGVSAAAEAGTDPVAVAGGVTGVGDAMVSMAAAQYAFLASLQAARTSNEMVAQAIDLGRY